MFGNQDFEVFQTSNKRSLRIRKSFKKYFAGSIDAEKDDVYFEFFNSKYSIDPCIEIARIYKNGKK